MKTGRQGAFLLLAMVVLWTALPASACLLGHHAMARPACCRAMKGCDSPAMSADNACCKIQGSSVAVVPALPYCNDDHAQQTAILPSSNTIVSSTAQLNRCTNAFKTPPPKFPPGGALALRI